MPSHSKGVSWLPSFRGFIEDIRISSKETLARDERGTPLILWKSQDMFVQAVADALDNDQRTLLCLKGRQLGVTTVSLAITLFWLAVHPNLRMAHVADAESNAERNRQILGHYVASFPDEYFDNFRVLKNNRKFILFSNGSRLDFLIAGVRKKSSPWGEGQGYTAAHLTEVSHYGDPDALASFEESLAQDHPSRLFLYESVAQGRNHFFDRWMAAMADPFKATLFIGWWANPLNSIAGSDPRWVKFGPFPPNTEERELIGSVETEYGVKINKHQLCWRRWKETNANAQTEMLSQNQPWTWRDAFVQTGASFFPTRQIGDLMSYIYDHPDEFGYQGYYYKYSDSFFTMELVLAEEDGDKDLIELKVWEEPDPRSNYVIGFDPAFGRNEHKDKHCISVWKCYADKMVQVAEYCTADVDVKHATWAMCHLAGAYENCMINVELVGPGRLVMTEMAHIRELLVSRKEVPNRPTDWEDALQSARWYLYNKPDTMGKGYVANHECTWRTQQELMHGFRGAFVTGELSIHSANLYSEMLVVVSDGNTIHAPESSSPDCKDDRVFGAALAVRAWVEWIRPALIAEGFTYRSALAAIGADSSQAAFMNHKIKQFLRGLQEDFINEGSSEAEAPAWMVERGLAS